MFNNSKVASALVLTAVSSVLLACSRTEEPQTYEDCILQRIPTAKTEAALELIKAACKGKFSKVFDFDAIASAASVSSWREVALKSDFSNLPEAEKSEARKEYFESVIVPRVDSAYVEDARTQFDAFSRQAERAASANSSTANTTARP